jgi:hypothetical protein
MPVLAIYRRQRIWSWECPVNHRCMLGWLCSVLAEVMVMWRWQNVLPNKFLKWTSYVLLLNIYAAAGNGHLCEDIERQRKEKGAKKQLGCTWIEVNNEVHTFVVEDQDHPQMMEIHAELQRLSRLMHDAGYVPCTEFVLDDVEEEKVFHLCNHSEKLAVAFGLINTAPGTPL